MRLEISVDKYQDRNYFQLVNEYSATFANPLFKASDITFIKGCAWFLPFIRNDRYGLLNGISDNQFMVALYFYLQDYSCSNELKQQWFIDTGCSFNEAENLALLLSKAHLIKMETGIDMPEIEQAFAAIKTETINLPYIFELVSCEQPVHWTYDSLPVINKAGYSNINLKQLSETAFMIEDHSCIIVGFSNDFTSFLELISGYKSILLGQLCKLVPIYLRDIYSVGRLFDENPDFVKLVINVGIKDVEFYGLDTSGRLVLFRNYSMIQFNKPENRTLENNEPENERQNIIPLYAKFIK